MTINYLQHLSESVLLLEILPQDEIDIVRILHAAGLIKADITSLEMPEQRALVISITGEGRAMIARSRRPAIG